MLEVGWPDPAWVLDRIASTRSCCPRSATKASWSPSSLPPVVVRAMSSLPGVGRLARFQAFQFQGSQASAAPYPAPKGGQGQAHAEHTHGGDRDQRLTQGGAVPAGRGQGAQPGEQVGDRVVGGDGGQPTGECLLRDERGRQEGERKEQDEARV